MSTLNDPVVAAQDLRATILEGRKETEATRRLTPLIVRGLIDSGLCRLVLPKELGGHETEPRVFLLVLEELAKAEAAVAWFVWNSAVTGFSAAVLNRQTRTELFAKPDRLFANSTRPTGKAKLVKGGFRVSGRWSLVSGCDLAEWIPVMNRVVDGNGSRFVGDNATEMRMTFIPRGSFKILDTWYVGGLRGTGSHDIVVEDVFVPSQQTYSYLDPIRLSRPLYRMPSWATMSAGCAAICLGLAQNTSHCFGAYFLKNPQASPRRNGLLLSNSNTNSVFYGRVTRSAAAAAFHHHRLMGNHFPRHGRDADAVFQSVGERPPFGKNFQGNRTGYV